MKYARELTLESRGRRYTQRHPMATFLLSVSISEPARLPRPLPGPVWCTGPVSLTVVQMYSWSSVGSTQHTHNIIYIGGATYTHTNTLYLSKNRITGHLFPLPNYPNFRAPLLFQLHYYPSAWRGYRIICHPLRRLRSDELFIPSHAYPVPGQITSLTAQLHMTSHVCGKMYAHSPLYKVSLSDIHVQ